MMSEATGMMDVLYSTLGGDADLGELVEMFVDEMPERVGNIERLFESQNWEELRRAAHQLKGAAGSYGFEEITPRAARLEDAVREQSPAEQILQAVKELCDLCRRAQAGVPE